MVFAAFEKFTTGNKPFSTNWIKFQNAFTYLRKIQLEINISTKPLDFIPSSCLEMYLFSR